MTGQKKTIRRKNEYEIGTEYFDKEPLLYGKEKDHLSLIHISKDIGDGERVEMIRF